MAGDIQIEIGGKKVKALFEAPAGKGPFPGIVVAYHKCGYDSFTHWVVEDLAAKGFVAIAPDHFHWLPSPEAIPERRKYLTDDRLAADLDASRRYLASLDIVGDGRFGIIGHCMGGRTALLGAAVDPNYKAACIWYSGNAFKPQGEGPSPVDRIPDIKARVRGFYGNLDKNPSPDDVNRLDAALTAANIPHEFYRYDGVGHAFMNPEHEGGTPYNESVAMESWKVATDFLSGELKA